jgi:hypothetical protein
MSLLRNIAGEMRTAFRLAGKCSRDDRPPAAIDGDLALLVRLHGFSCPRKYRPRTDLTALMRFFALAKYTVRKCRSEPMWQHCVFFEPPIRRVARLRKPATVHAPFAGAISLAAISLAAMEAAKKAAKQKWRDEAATSMTAKDVKFSTEARNKMLRGIDLLAQAVEVTLGPKGRNVVIEKSFGAPRITKDGVTVAKEIELPDRFENMGAQMLREVAARTSDTAGDGTTTATVLAHSIVREGVKAVAAGMNPMDLKRGIDLAVQAIVPTPWPRSAPKASSPSRKPRA